MAWPTGANAIQPFRTASRATDWFPGLTRL
jgi:hypothetical protein